MIEKIFWHGWKAEELLGRGASGRVYRITRMELGQKQEAVLKVIRVPSGETEIMQMRQAGLSEEEIRQTLLQRVLKAGQELAVLCALKGSSHIVNYEDQAVFQRKKLQWEVCLQMELLTPLPDYLKEKPVSLEDIIRIGIHICKALEICENKNIVHRDIKPENIFADMNGDFKLGDFGIALTDFPERNRIPVPESDRKPRKETDVLTGTRGYLAPEVVERGAYSSFSDQYALGITLKKLLEHLERTEHQKKQGKTESHRLNELKDVAQKASAPEPQQRFENASVMRSKLEKIISSEKIPGGRHGRYARIALLAATAGLAVCIGHGDIGEQDDTDAKEVGVHANAENAEKSEKNTKGVETEENENNSGSVVKQQSGQVQQKKAETEKSAGQKQQSAKSETDAENGEKKGEKGGNDGKQKKTQKEKRLLKKDTKLTEKKTAQKQVKSSKKSLTGGEKAKNQSNGNSRPEKSAAGKTTLSGYMKRQTTRSQQTRQYMQKKSESKSSGSISSEKSKSSATNRSVSHTDKKNAEGSSGKTQTKNKTEKTTDENISDWTPVN